MKLSINKISEITGQDRRRIKRIAEAALTPEIEGKSHLYESRDLIPLLYDTAGYGQKLDLTQERALLAHFQAKKAEVELKTMQGEYVPLEEVELAIASDYTNCRAKLLALPTKMAPVVIGISEIPAAKEALEKMIYEALEVTVSP